MQDSFSSKVFVVNKYGRKNIMSSDKRYIYFDALLTEMSWKDSADSKTPSQTFKTSSFVSINPGRETKNF